MDDDSWDRARAVLEGLAGPAVLTDADGKLMGANTAFARTAGTTRGALADRSLRSLVADEPERLASYLRQCSGSRAAIPGALVLHDAEGMPVRCRVRGQLVMPAAHGQPGILLLSFTPPRGLGNAFSLLSKKVSELNAEIRRRISIERRLDAELAEKALLLRELQHRVKNNFQVMLSLFRISQYQEQDAHVRDKLLTMQNRVAAMAAVHDMLYSSGESLLVDGGGFLRKLCQQVSDAYARPDIELVVSAERVMLPADVAAPLGLLANELVSNAYKHAFGETATGLVEVALERRDQGLCLSVRDNGAGIQTKAGGGLGLSLVEGWVLQLDGELQRDARGGTSFLVRIPDPGASMSGVVYSEARAS